MKNPTEHFDYIDLTIELQFPAHLLFLCFVRNEQFYQNIMYLIFMSDEQNYF